MFSQKDRKSWTPKGKPDHRAYAIGDVHGCLDELKEILAKIKIHNSYRSEARTFIIFLGDLIDRGPDSRGVLELLLDFPYDFAEPLFVMGNHEEMMVRGLMGEAKLLPDWLEYGGYSCAESYGVQRSQLLGQTPDALEFILRSAIPKRHVSFMQQFLDYVQFGDFLFTHAGIRPGVPLHEQISRELRWIRKPFLDFEGDHGVVVVHGHTISDTIDHRANRIGLDTGAYKTGKLSAICVDEDQISFIETSDGD